MLDAPLMSRPRAVSRRAMELGAIVAGRFVVGAGVARGGIGAVYRAHDRLTDGPVALKILTVRSREHAARFVRETEVLSRFRHPSVVAHVASGALPSGDAFLALEWLTGGTLAALLRKRRLTCEEALGLLRHAAKALGKAHEEGLVHRDVTPSNLFVCTRGDVPLKLLDFGLVRVLSETGALTRTGVGLGTPGYMPPEQLVGARDSDARGDVFALGCVLFEALSGAPPFGDGEVTEILRRTMFEDAPALPDDPSIPADVAALIARMLARAPADRPADGAEVSALMSDLYRSMRRR